CMPARTIRMGRTTTSARAGTALRPTATTPPPPPTASPEARYKASRSGCNTTSRLGPLESAQPRGGHRMMSASIFIELDLHHETHRLRCNAAGGTFRRRAAGAGGVRFQGGRYGLRRRQALQLGGVEENPRYLPAAAGH